MVKDERGPIPPPHWLTNQRAGGGFLKVSCAQVHVSGLPVHTLVVTLHLLCRCDNDGEHRAAAGPGRCWCCSADPERGLDPVNSGPALSFSMNISSSRRRVTRTEGAASPWGPGPGGAGATEQTAFSPTEEKLTNRRFYQFFGIMSGASTPAPLSLTAPELLSAGRRTCRRRAPLFITHAECQLFSIFRD